MGLALVYFMPAIFEGRELFQQDVAGASGTASDVRALTEATGEVSYWTNSLFGGMPMYQISPSYPSLWVIHKLQTLLTLQWPFTLLPNYSWLLFALLAGGYIFLRALRLGRPASILGAVMWTFSSYFLILIAAGHIWKLMTLCFIPPTLAGILYIYRGQYLKGAALTALFASLQILSNHVQMSYYFGFLILFLLIAFLVEAVRTGQLRRFVLSTLVLLGSGLIAIGINSSNLYHTYEYGAETIRGGSELTPLAGQGAQTKEATASGLDKDYITAWSYGKGETLTLLVPNAYGGATGALAEDADAMGHIPSEYQQILGQLNHYWGDQPFTAGPVYVGAFVLFLFLLGCFVVEGPIKWALVGATIFSIALAWGHNMMWLTDLFIDYVPLYNKFRTVSSILVIAEFTIPVLAVLALVRFVERPRELVEEHRGGFLIAGGLTLGLSLVLALIPGTFLSLISEQEQELFRQAMAQGQMPVSELMAALKEARASIVSADAWRSFFIILLSLGVCGLYYQGRLRAGMLYLLLGTLTLLDLWQVDKRYLHDELFIDKALVEQQAAPVTEADRLIAQDKDKHYRVMNLSVNTFNDATTSAQHRSVGGYHAAKLRRYQDLIERQLSQQNMQAYNMLDTRYFILPPQAGQGGAPVVQRNEEAFGAAWFVDSIAWVKGADAEMAALSTLPLRRVAAVDERFASQLQGYRPTQLIPDSTVGADPAVELLDYQPAVARYRVTTPQPRLLVFSEVYYPHGWHLVLDGAKELELVRADYTLRAAWIPAGTHELVLRFDPQSIHRTELVAEVSSALLVLLLLAALATAFLPRRARPEDSPQE